MRENRTSGSEGGAAEPNRSSLPLSYLPTVSRQKRLTALPEGVAAKAVALQDERAGGGRRGSWSDG